MDTKTFDTTPVTGFGAADGPLNAIAAACVPVAPSTAEEMVATDSTTASGAMRDTAVNAEVAADLTTTVESWFADVELANSERFVRVVTAESAAVCESPCGSFDVAVSRATSDCTGSAEGDAASDSSTGDATADSSTGDTESDSSTSDSSTSDSSTSDFSTDEATATAEGTPVWVGVASADPVVSLLDWVAPLCTPPELCTTPESESAVEA